MVKYSFFIFAFLFVSLTAFSQEEVIEELEHYNYPTKIPEKLSPILEGDFKIPTPISNRSFGKIANGIGDINLIFNYPVFDKFLIGAGFKFGYYQFIDFLTNNSFSNSGKLFGYSPYGKISYLKFSNPRLFFQFSTKLGYSLLDFNSFTCTNVGEEGRIQEFFFIEPQVSAHIFVDESLSFSLAVSDYIGFNNFNPSLLCLESFPGFTPENSIGNYNILGIGFGFTYFFNKKGEIK